MVYKTMVLERLRSAPALYRQLRTTRTLMAALEQYAAELKAAHEYWKVQLRETAPSMDPISRTNAALELALAEWEERLASKASPPESVEDFPAPAHPPTPDD
jgi:hypothetical protein